MSFSSQLESILFVSSKPLTISQIVRATGMQVKDVEDAIEKILIKYNTEDSGIHIMREADTVRMATNAKNAEHIEQFIKNEVTGELTKAQLETLTVIAYRSPITRSDLEKIRGVNCAVILRNLMMRGLVTQYDSSDEILPTYVLTTDALSHLGILETSELPQYETLSTHEHIEHILEDTDE